ncbi:MAG: NAD(P)-binding domain-containing protein [Gemmatimonadota bacterium]|jgi:putative flavoprotein involved in K+ transport
MSARSEDRIDTIVIGGSQSGLAVGYHLARTGVPFVILDENPRIGDAWRRRWDSLRLFTPARYDGLPGMRFPASPWTYPTKDQVADYLDAYARRFELPVRSGTRVVAVRHDGHGFRVETEAREWRADNVVVATGAYHVPRIPAFAPELGDAIVQLHSSEYERPGQLAPGPVLVVGAGNSGAEIAMEVCRDHPTRLSGPDTGQEPTRAGSLPDRLLVPLMWLAASRILAVSNPIGRKARDHFLDPPRGIPLGRVRRKDIGDAGIERVPRTVGVEGGLPVVDGGRVLDVRTVIWCTGFVADYSWIDLPVFGDYGMPEHERGVVSGRPGLFFVGLPFQHTLSSALIGGVGRDAAYIAARIRERRSVAPAAVAAGSSAG